jgi:hypothetical protein
MKRSQPMKRSPFKPKPFELADKRTALRRSAIKSRVKKPTVAEGSKYLAACRGEPCYLNATCPWTDWADPTVVPCHSNFAKHGKAGARKADHEFSVPGCMQCHSWLDAGPAPYEEKLSKFESALGRWIPRRARKMGIEVNQPEEETA